MNARIRATLVAVALAISAFAFDTPAEAGTYNVSQCDPTVGSGLDGWAPWHYGSWQYLDQCVSGTVSAIATGHGSDRAAGWVTPWLPDNLYMTHVTYITSSVAGAANIWIHGRFCVDMNRPCGTPAAIRWLDNTPGTETVDHPWVFDGVGAKQYELSISHNDGSFGAGSGQVAAGGFNFTVNDISPPYLDTQPGGTLSTSSTAWNRGIKIGSVTAGDSGGGVKQITGQVDGTTWATIDQACDYRHWSPCPQPTGWNPSINTTSYADGSHAITYTAKDAGNNVTTSTPQTFKVDNTQPATPSNVQGVSSDGWNATNDFDLSWTNSGETIETATQSGIASVQVDVDPVDAATQTDPAALTIPIGTTVSGASSTINSVNNLTVPAKGAWKLKLAVVDRAGNVSPLGNGSNGAADGVFNIGFDDTPPFAPAGQANGWISRDELANGYHQEWSLTKAPNALAPICGFATSVTSAQADPGNTINVNGDVRSMVLPTNLSEGNHWVNLRSVTCAHVASVSSEHVQAQVDLTDPEGTVSGVSDGEWYQDNKVVQLHGADGLSGMVSSPNNDPLNGAYLAYSINGAPTSLIAGSAGSFPVSGEGSKELSFSAVDLAGNKAKATLVRFGIDATKPSGGFNKPPADHPTLLSAPIKDPVSGIAFATIEVQNQAGGDWIVLPTSIADDAGNAVAGFPKHADVSARFPDTRLPRGTYNIRLRAVDRAGNSLLTNKRLDGSEMTVTNPMRDATSLSAGLSRPKRICQKKRGVKCVKRYRGKVVFSNTYPTLSVGFKRSAVVQGFLTTDRLERLSRQPIEIYAATNKGNEVLLGSTSTRPDGSYQYKIKPGVSRTIRVYYPGTELREDTSATVQLGTGAKLGLRVSRKHAYTGQTVHFIGTVRSSDGSLPSSGKIVALQFYANKKWRPAVAIAHTDSKGRFNVSYKFDGQRVKAQIVFRVFAPTEDNWVHAASASKRVTLRLN